MKILMVVYDNGDHTHWFPIGLGYISSALLDAGHEVDVYNQDMHHYPEEHLTDFLNKNTYDVVGVSVIGGYYQYNKLLSISNAINKSHNRPFYIIGGHGPSPEPEYFINKTKADAIIIGEGERTIVDLLNNLSNLKDVKGIAYKDGDSVTVNKRRSLIKDVNSISWPAYHKFPIEYYRLNRFRTRSHLPEFTMPVLSGRGCKFKCNFCYRMDKGFRPRSAEGIIEEVSFLKKEYDISTIVFFDELLMSSEKRTISLCEKFIEADLNINWYCNGRLNYATPDVLKVMKKAGCVFINYGIECMDNKILKVMKKNLVVDTIIKGIENTLAEDISPGLNIIFGNIGEDRDTLQKGVDFLCKYDDAATLRTIRPVTPYPGSGLYYHALEKGLLKDCEDFYENKHLNSDFLSVNFTKLSDDEFYESLKDANCKLIDNHYKKKIKSSISQTTDLYNNRDYNFRGFRS